MCIQERARRCTLTNRISSAKLTLKAAHRARIGEKSVHSRVIMSGREKMYTTKSDAAHSVYIEKLTYINAYGKMRTNI